MPDDDLMRMSDSIETGANSDIQQELVRLREKLAYYESFDQLIQKSVTDASELLREALEMREAASREIEAASKSAESARTSQLETYRSLFSEMLDEITLLQGHAERLARRLTDAIDALEAQLLPEVDFPGLPTTLTAELATTIDEPPDAGVEPAVSVRSVESVELESTHVDDGAVVASQVDSDAERVEEEAITTVAPDLSPAESPETAEDVPVGASPDGRFVLLVHGVHKAALALSLKSYLEELDVVDKVEPREFAAGLLRLQLQVQRNLEQDDLAGWPSGQSIQIVHVRPGLLEVKLT